MVLAMTGEPEVFGENLSNAALSTTNPAQLGMEAWMLR
jgi:hypothetical protein